MKLINLNADMGEGFGQYGIGNDAAMLEIIGSANVACGYHAGDPLVMSKTAQLAKEKGVSIGAHPAFPDLQGFGRRKMVLPLDELEAMMVYQIGALMAVATSQGSRVTHVKPHGALNNMAAEDMEMSRAIARAIRSVNPDLIMLATAGSCLCKAGLELGLPTAGEIFADRTYDEEGNLTSRSLPNAVIHDPEQSAEQILSFVEAGKIITPSGKGIETPIHSICVHGDTAEAVAIAQRVKERLEQAGYRLAPLPEVMGLG
ncbi:5-oxoprolinase subunit PxpA [Kiloniella laminariae]|uniref:LamB/YcsF family protein n=1 Tax=Kiloniella laminariae TaxID=454162 RepID=UPI00035EAA0F